MGGRGCRILYMYHLQQMFHYFSSTKPTKEGGPKEGDL